MGKSAQDYHAELEAVDESIDVVLSRLIRTTHRLEALRKRRKRLVKIVADEEAKAKAAKEAKRLRPRPRQAEPEPTEIQASVLGQGIEVAGGSQVRADARAEHAARMKAAGFRPTRKRQEARP
jgi:hypothetical protein